jgi:peptidoglycan L-alanyl-D-glutamate endopeptidase CwlK
MPTRNINDAAPTLQAAYLAAVAQWQQLHPSFPQPFLTCVYRSVQEQDALYNQGRTTAGPRVTNARGGQSKHNSIPSRAIDIAFKNSRGQVNWNVAYFREFARIIQSIDSSVRWGGNFRTITDNPHFEI